jgi:hypothetical protein
LNKATHSIGFVFGHAKVFVVKGWGEKHQHREQKQQTNQKFCPKLPSHDAFILAGKNPNSWCVALPERFLPVPHLFKKRIKLGK